MDRHLDHTLKAWALPIIAIGIAVLIALTGEAGRETLSFDRPAIAQGAIWRLVSGHFVHLGVSHVILNVAGLLLIWYLVSSFLNSRQWLFVAGVSIVGIDLGLWFFEPQLLWYVGLSALLHGLLGAGVVAGFRSGGIDIRILSVALIAKIAYEQLVGPLPGSEEATGGAVIVASHAYGALAGAIAAALIAIRAHVRASI